MGAGRQKPDALFPMISLFPNIFRKYEETSNTAKPEVSYVEMLERRSAYENLVEIHSGDVNIY